MSRLIIIGAGFSGVVAAIEFMRHAPDGAKVTMVNRSGRMARGLAYGTSSQHHLLNVPAGNMSAILDEPDSFLSFCQNTRSDIHSGSFVPRAVYGAYLENLLASAEAQNAPRVACERITGDIVSIEKQGSDVTLKLASGEQLTADHVILAFGNFSPANPIPLSRDVSNTTYVPDPWAPGVELVSNSVKKVLLIGAGLTAVDVLLTIKRLYPAIKVVMLSRRGLLPKGHREILPNPKFITDIDKEILSATPSARSYLKVVREHVNKSPEHWREIVAALRPITPELWSRMPSVEKRRFLRHLQVYWDVHRHRLAPETYRAFQNEMTTESVKLIAGRVESVCFSESDASVEIRARGSLQAERLLFDKIINCTGPCTGISKINDGLISDLVQKGVLSSDALELGLTVDEDYSLLSESGEKNPWISYVGPMLRARLWEATAVPELRFHAKQLAVRIANLFVSAQANDLPPDKY